MRSKDNKNYLVVLKCFRTSAKFQSKSVSNNKKFVHIFNHETTNICNCTHDFLDEMCRLQEFTFVASLCSLGCNLGNF